MLLATLTADYLFLELWAIEYSCLILSTLTTHIKSELLGKLAELWLKLADRLIEVDLLQPHATGLHNPGIHFAINHLLQQLVLIAEPKVRQTDHTQALTDVLYSEPLVVTEDSTTCDGLYLRVLLLDG